MFRERGVEALLPQLLSIKKLLFDVFHPVENIDSAREFVVIICLADIRTQNRIDMVCFL